MGDPFFFGYGSLVNRGTHDFAEVYPARIAGWRRAWRHSGTRAVSYLTVLPERGAESEGLIAAVPGGDWAALDARERAYARHAVGGQVAHGAGRSLHIEVYAVPERELAPPSGRHPILLSYIDTVVQGYLQVHGTAGVERFFATTLGWDGPVADDRARPRYARATPCTAAERALVDGWLARLGVHPVQASGALAQP